MNTSMKLPPDLALAYAEQERRRRQTIVEGAPKYEPIGSIAALFACEKQEVLVSGPAGTGKTRGCLEKLHYYCSNFERLRCLIVRKTRESLTESALVTYEDHVLNDIEREKIVRGLQRRNRTVYQYDNGSVIVVAGLTVGGRNQVAKIMSTEYDMIFVPEATELELSEYQKLITRLRNHRLHFQQLLADCNPDSPQHWLYLRSQSNRTRLIESTHFDNPVLYDAKTNSGLLKAKHILID